MKDEITDLADFYALGADKLTLADGLTLWEAQLLMLYILETILPEGTALTTMELGALLGCSHQNINMICQDAFLYVRQRQKGIKYRRKERPASGKVLSEETMDDASWEEAA